VDYRYGLVDHTWCLVDHTWCLVDHTWCLVDHTWCLVDTTPEGSTFNPGLAGITPLGYSLEVEPVAVVPPTALTNVFPIHKPLGPEAL
jgi:hypothetical protein